MAVRRGLPRPQGRLPRARHPGHRRQRQPLQPDRRDRDPADAGGRGARRHRRRHPPHPDGLRRPPATGCSCSARPARSSPARSGRTSCTATSAALPPQVDLRRRAGARPSCSSTATGRAVTQRPRPLRRRPGAGARGVRLRRGIGCTVALQGDAFVALFAESTARAIVTTRDAAALSDLAARHGVPLTSLGGTGGDVVVEGQFSVPVDELRTAWTTTLPAALG